MTTDQLAALLRRAAAIHAMVTDPDAPPFALKAFEVLAGEWHSLRSELAARGEWAHFCNQIGIDPGASLASLTRNR